MYNHELYPFESKWVEIENHKIHYVDEGQGQVLLFSHAALGSSFMFRRFIQILSKNHRCIALDYPGFGLSEGKAECEYTVASQCRILGLFIGRLRLEDIIALGHDTGGPSLFKVATDYPELFRGLILTDTIIFPTMEYGRIHRMLNILGSRAVRFVNRYTNFLVRLTFNKGVVTRSLSAEERKQYHDLFNTHQKRERIIQMLSSLRQQSDHMKIVKKGFETELNGIPTLLIYGEKDPVTELGIPDRIHAMLKNSELFFIKKEGHFPHEGQPERMSEIISQWVLINWSDKAEPMVVT